MLERIVPRNRGGIISDAYSPPSPQPEMMPLHTVVAKLFLCSA